MDGVNNTHRSIGRGRTWEGGARKNARLNGHCARLDRLRILVALEAPQGFVVALLVVVDDTRAQRYDRVSHRDAIILQRASLLKSQSTPLSGARHTRVTRTHSSTKHSKGCKEVSRHLDRRGAVSFAVEVHGKSLDCLEIGRRVLVDLCLDCRVLAQPDHCAVHEYRLVLGILLQGQCTTWVGGRVGVSGRRAWQRRVGGCALCGVWRGVEVNMCTSFCVVTAAKKPSSCSEAPPYNEHRQHGYCTGVPSVQLLPPSLARGARRGALRRVTKYAQDMITETHPYPERVHARVRALSHGYTHSTAFGYTEPAHPPTQLARREREVCCVVTM